MTPTRITHLAGMAVLALAVSYLCALVLYRYLPPLPRSSFATFLILAAAEAAYASSITARRAGRPRTKPIMPIVVARAAALAKASSVMAAIGCGVWGALLAFTAIHRDDYSSAGRDTVTSATALASSVLLVAAALYLEKSCRVKEPPTGATGDLSPPMEEL